MPQLIRQLTFLHGRSWVKSPSHKSRDGARSRGTGPRPILPTTTCPGLLAQEDHAMLLRVGAQADPDEVHAARNPGATLVGAVPRRRVTARRHRALGQRSEERRVGKESRAQRSASYEKRNECTA